MSSGPGVPPVIVVANLWPTARRPAFGSFVRNRVDALRAAGALVTVVRTPDSGSTVFRYAVLAARVVVALVRARIGLVRRPGAPRPVVETHVAYPTGVVVLPLARALRLPVVLVAHGSDVTALPARSALDGWLARWAFGRADLVVAVSPFLQRQARELLSVRDTAVVASGIRYAALAAAARPADERRGILCAARLVESKGVLDLVEAVGTVRGHGHSDLHLTLVGDGPLRAELSRRARELGVPLDLPGEVAAAELARWMGSAAVVAVPSTHPEGLGLTALEGMAAGAVVVATSAGALGDTVVEGVTGFSCRPGDVTSLAGALERALACADGSRSGRAPNPPAEPGAAAEIRERADALAREHDVAVSARRSMRMYAERFGGPVPNSPRPVTGS